MANIKDHRAAPYPEFWTSVSLFIFVTEMLVFVVLRANLIFLLPAGARRVVQIFPS